MLLKILSLSLLLAILSGCVRTSYKYDYSTLPKLPTAGASVAQELEDLCIVKNSCKAINDWLNELYFFSKEYSVYRGTKND